MRVEIGRALREGFGATVSRNGLTFLAFSYVLAVLGRAVAGYVPAVLPLPGGQVGLPGAGSAAPAVDLPLPAFAVVVVVLLLASVAVMAAALRTFADDADRIALGHVARNYPRMVANLAAGTVVEAVLVGGLWTLALAVAILGILGLSAGGWGVAGLLLAVVVFALLVAAALVVLEALYFWYVFVVVEDRGVVDAFRGSWRAVEGNRPALFVLGILVWVVNTVVTAAALVLAFPLPSPVDFLVAQAGSALATVFTLATTARTYVQLVDEGAVDGTHAPAGTGRDRRRMPARDPVPELEAEVETRDG